MQRQLCARLPVVARNPVICNAKDLPFRGTEADILSVSTAGYVTEIEVKVSVEDFRREFSGDSATKAHKHRWLLARSQQEKGFARVTPTPRECVLEALKEWWIAVPAELLPRLEMNLLPPYAGLIAVPDDLRRRPYAVRPAAKFKCAVPHPKLVAQEFTRLAAWRYWSTIKHPATADEFRASPASGRRAGKRRRPRG